MPPRGPRKLLCVVVVTKLRVRNRTRMLTAGDEPGDVRHVDEQKRADRIGDLAQPREIDDARISRCAGGDHHRPNFFGLFLQRVVIDLLGLLAHAVLRDVVKFAGEIRRMAVGEMAAVREIHGQNLVARFQHRKINRHVRLRAAVRLNVDVLAAEQALRAIDRELLGRIDVFAAAVPAFPRITFGVFVGQHAALRFHHRAAGEIFRGDQLDVFALAFFFRAIASKISGSTLRKASP